MAGVPAGAEQRSDTLTLAQVRDVAADGQDLADDVESEDLRQGPGVAALARRDVVEGDSGRLDPYEDLTGPGSGTGGCSTLSWSGPPAAFSTTWVDCVVCMPSGYVNNSWSFFGN